MRRKRATKKEKRKDYKQVCEEVRTRGIAGEQHMN